MIDYTTTIVSLSTTFSSTGSSRERILSFSINVLSEGGKEGVDTNVNSVESVWFCTR